MCRNQLLATGDQYTLFRLLKKEFAPFRTCSVLNSFDQFSISGIKIIINFPEPNPFVYSSTFTAFICLINGTQLHWTILGKSFRLCFLDYGDFPGCIWTTELDKKLWLTPGVRITCTHIFYRRTNFKTVKWWNMGLHSHFFCCISRTHCLPVPSFSLFSQFSRLCGWYAGNIAVGSQFQFSELLAGRPSFRLTDLSTHPTTTVVVHFRHLKCITPSSLEGKILRHSMNIQTIRITRSVFNLGIIISCKIVCSHKAIRKSLKTRWLCSHA